MMTALPTMEPTGRVSDIVLVQEGKGIDGRTFSASDLAKFASKYVNRPLGALATSWEHRNQTVIGYWQNIRVTEIAGRASIVADFTPLPWFRETPHFKYLENAVRNDQNRFDVSIVYTKQCGFQLYGADFVREGNNAAGLHGLGAWDVYDPDPTFPTYKQLLKYLPFGQFERKQNEK